MARPPRPDAATVAVHAKPRAKKSRILGFKEGALEVALAAPPVDGAANEELVRVLADALGVPARDVRVERGASGRRKLVRVEGMSDAAARDRLTALVGQSS
ncbi:MAG: DUF167 domain-containing protein [Myxococcales bacterium]|nr:DUF167 domain-containing protein [Myxococcales bacterium]